MSELNGLPICPIIRQTMIRNSFDQPLLSVEKLNNECILKISLSSLLLSQYPSEDICVNNYNIILLC